MHSDLLMALIDYLIELKSRRKTKSIDSIINKKGGGNYAAPLIVWGSKSKTFLNGNP